MWFLNISSFEKVSDIILLMDFGRSLSVFCGRFRCLWIYNGSLLVFFCSPSYYHNGFVGTHALWAHNVRLHIVGNNEPKSAQKAKQGAQYRWS